MPQSQFSNAEKTTHLSVKDEVRRGLGRLSIGKMSDIGKSEQSSRDQQRTKSRKDDDDDNTDLKSSKRSKSGKGNDLSKTGKGK